MSGLISGLGDLGLDQNELKELEGLFGEESALSEEVIEEETPIEDSDEAPETDDVELDDEGKESDPEDSEDEVDALEAIEIIETKDGKTVKIDYNDRDRIKRAHLLARQGRVWQSERDELKSKYETLEASSSENGELVDLLNKHVDDIPELYRLITGGEDWDAMIDETVRQREEIAQLTPEQLEVYNRSKLAEKRERQLDRREAEMASKLEDSENTRTQAEINTQRAMINSAFNEYRFHGTLGDKVQEHRLDKMVFNTIRTELNGKDVGEPEVRELIKREFDLLRSSIGQQSKKVAQTTNKKRVAAATKKAAEKATGKSSAEKTFQERLDKGDIGSILSDGNWMDMLKKL